MSKFDDIAEKIIFKNRAIILALFVLITGAMVFFASQLKVDAGFNKQVPLQHEYMRTFTDYMSDFGGANRVLIAVIAKDLLSTQHLSFPGLLFIVVVITLILSILYAWLVERKLTGLIFSR